MVAMVHGFEKRFRAEDAKILADALKIVVIEVLIRKG
ncbi:uncharacterized protein METZ01_LOCUS161152 [marine metagenome]|uniref:Uncharacterized protein n=1 Tax=marine metagenome TaxID=408172 RepID=A0A382B3G7_9ZZZZ